MRTPYQLGVSPREHEAIDLATVVFLISSVSAVGLLVVVRRQPDDVAVADDFALQPTISWKQEEGRKGIFASVYIR